MNARSTRRSAAARSAPPRELWSDSVSSYSANPQARRMFARGLSIQVAYAVIDACCVIVNGALMYFLRFGRVYSLEAQIAFFRTHTARAYIGFFVLYAALVVLSCMSQNLYRTPRDRGILDEIWRVIKAVAIATSLLALFIFISGNKEISRLVIGLSAVLDVSTLSGWRSAKRHVVMRRSQAGIGLTRVLIVGTGRLGRAVARWLQDNRHYGYEFCGFIDPHPSDDPKVLGTPRDLRAVALANFVDEIFITIPSDCELVKSTVREARGIRLGLKVIPDLYDGLGWHAPIDTLGGFPILQLHGQPIPVLGLATKRVIDILAASIGLVLAAPIILILALLIRVDSPGPIFYAADRIGRKGHRFRCLKFRTMVTDADAFKEKLRSINQRRGPFFKLEDDPRVTRLGRWLRKLSIDELPQLLNVLAGDMSLVGPRPHPTDDYERYDIEDLRRLDVKPGLTGLWQVTARSDPSFQTNMNLDLEYIENWTLWLDFKILLKTFPAILRAEGS